MVVGVAHEKADGCPSGLAFEDTAEQFHTVGLLARGGQVALSRTAPVEFVLDEVHIDFDAGGHAVNHASHPWSMAFAEGGQPEDVAKGVAHVSILHNLHNRLPVRSRHSCHRCIHRSLRH